MVNNSLSSTLTLHSLINGADKKSINLIINYFEIQDNAIRYHFLFHYAALR